MNQKRTRRVPLAVSLLATAVTLSGCGGLGGGIASQPVTFGGTTESINAPVSGGSSGPVFRGNTVQVFAANGSPQIVVKTRSGGSVTATHPRLHKVRSIQPLRVDVLAVDPSLNVNEALQQLKADPNVVYAEPNFVVRALDTSFSDDLEARKRKPSPNPSYPSVTPPNDPKFGEQYGPQQIHAPEAWTKTRGANVVVAVIDTGTDVTHPEFNGKIVAGFAASDASPTLQPPEKDDNGHGTHVSGIAAATANNGEGIAGVAVEAKIMPVKVLSAEGSGSDAGVAEGIVWAADHGANVINMSLGGPGSSQVLEDAVKHALEKGVVVVAAMGNDGDNSKSYPAAIPGVIAVGAVDRSGTRADFSQYGNWISVAAPGVSILSTFPTYRVDLNKYGFPMNYASLDGTSMATPHVAGLAALVKAVAPGLSPADAKKKIEQTAQRKNGKFNDKYGWGIVDAYGAVS